MRGLLLLIVVAGVVAIWMATRPAPLLRAAAPAGPQGQPGEAPQPAETPAKRTPREETPRARPGAPLRVELIEPRATRYADPAATEADAVYAELVQSLGRTDVTYDPRLGQAARELAYQQSVLGNMVPADALDFLLEAAGAVDKSVLQALARTSADDATDPMAPVRKRILELVGPPSSAPRRVGVGEALEPGARLGRTIAVLVSERSLLIQPVPVKAQGGTKWVLTGALPPATRDPHGLILGPDGEFVEIPARSGDGGRFTLEVPVPRSPGRLVVSLLATGPHGPGPLLQVPVYVDVPPPELLETAIPPDETLRDASEAELAAFALLNTDRARFGLPPLLRDLALDRIARAHSLDMRDNRWFGHWSDESGSPGDRLEAAGYRASGHAENVASARTIRGAQEGLLESLGHRRNILTTTLTHVGIGVVGRQEGTKVQWLLTQLFAAPAERVSRATAEAGVIARLNERRRALGLEPLTRVEALDQLAEGAALTAAQGGTDVMAAELIDAARAAGETRGGAYGATQVVAGPGDISLPEAVGHASFQRFGLAVVQLPDHPAGIVGVGLLLTGPRSP